VLSIIADKINYGLVLFANGTSLFLSKKNHTYESNHKPKLVSSK